MTPTTRSVMAAIMMSVAVTAEGGAEVLEPVNTLVKRTYVYKSAPDCDIHLDLFETEGMAGPTPVVVWIHGGALIMGSRHGGAAVRSATASRPHVPGRPIRRVPWDFPSAHPAPCNRTSFPSVS